MKTEKEKMARQSRVRALTFAAMAAWIFLLSSGIACFASTVVLQWNAVTDANLSGYKVHYQADSSLQPFAGTGSTQGVSPLNVSNLTSATVSGLDPSHTYYFAVTAYNTAGTESAYSNIITVPEMVSPAISLTAPANGASASGTVSVTADATDNVGVSKVEFYVNGVLAATDTATPYIYSWNTSALSAGTYTLMAKAYDAAGNVGQSGTASVNVVKDTTAPTVSVTAPASGAIVAGTTAITASASDSVGVSKVEFYGNGVLLFSTNVTPYSYNWNTTSVADGSYTLSSKAYDAAGNVGTSSNVAVTVKNTVADTVAPTVAISSPAANATVSGTVTATATASDNVGVSKVEFYVNGVLKATDTTSPYTFSWNTTSLANGSYTLSAKVYDAAGNVGTSSSVAVTVKNTAADPTKPIVAISSPAASATVSGTAAVTATASDNVGVAKVEFYVNGVLKATDTASPYTFSWNTTSLANGSYTLSAKAYDAAGNVGASSNVAVTVKNMLTIWSTTVPTVVDEGPDSAVELGVKFRSDINGYITGIRFYKASTNTGTHVGNLWSSAGKKLATVTFTNETASGWQQMKFSTPVAITANTVYVASYHTNVGHYSDDQNYFSGKGMDSAPLHALADGVSGSNGVYAYGSTSAFPNKSWNKSNYWVDVMFSTTK